MNSAYLETARLLTQVAPFVFVDVSDVNYFGVCHEAAVGKEAIAACCTRDEGRSLDIAFQEEVSNHPKLLRSRVVVVSVGGKGRLDLSGMGY